MAWQNANVSDNYLEWLNNEIIASASFEGKVSTLLNDDTLPEPIRVRLVRYFAELSEKRNENNRKYEEAKK